MFHGELAWTGKSLWRQPFTSVEGLMAGVLFSGRKSVEKVGKSAAVPSASSRRGGGKQARKEPRRQRGGAAPLQSHKQYPDTGSWRPLQRINCLIREGPGLKSGDKQPGLWLQTKNRVLADLPAWGCGSFSNNDRHIWVRGENKLPFKTALGGTYIILNFLISACFSNLGWIQQNATDLTFKRQQSMSSYCGGWGILEPGANCLILCHRGGHFPLAPCVLTR